MRRIIVIFVSFMTINLLCMSAYCLTAQERIDRLSPEDRLKHEELQKEIEEARIKEDALIKQQEERLKGRENDLSELENYIKSAVREIKYRGLVTDYDGKPVANAVVSGSVYVFDKNSELYFSRPEHFSVTTDEQGYFDISGSGVKLEIDNIKKDGYESGYGAVFDYGFIKYDPDNPEQNTFKIRKRGTVDYLIRGEMYFYCVFKDGTDNAYYPFLLDTWYDKYGVEKDKKDGGNGTKIAREVDPDRCLEILRVFNDDKSEFDLIFKTTGNDSGVILTREDSFIAPESGYQPEVRFHSTMVDPNNDLGRGYGSGEFNIYAFVQGPDKKFYSRIKLRLITDVNSKEVRLDCQSQTNPQGRRNLEYDEEFNSKEKTFRKSLNSYRRSLEQQAKEKKEVFDVKAFEKLVDEGKAPQAIEQFDAENKRQFEERQKQSAAQYEAELKAAGRWSEDPKERERLRKLYNQEQMDKAKEREEKAKQDSAKEYEAIMQQRGAYRNTKVEDATKKAAENAATEKAGAEK